MTSTKDKIIQVILKHQKITINDLADIVGINPISVRHHILKLEGEGVVDSAEERHGVGRPRRVYFLTESGQEQFPTRYLRLTNRLLERVKETFPQEMVEQLFSQMGEDMAEDIVSTQDVENLSIEDRLDLLQDLLRDEGFQVEWEKTTESYQIRELNCPYYHVGQNHPEVCEVDQTLISKMLAVPATKIQCLLNGDSYCTYVVPFIAVNELSTNPA
ncbi:MAG TPA: winged helix-turn-helix transcriptional regulator [Anaerolineales bacterium]|nr:winged helix-turn-helix transcriptional regulator [Anaerolineales bacterium]